MEEIEVKFLDVNISELKDKLEKLGAKLVGNFFYKRKSYDNADKSLTSKNAWVRLRDEGERTVLTYKQRLGIEKDTMQGGSMKEIEVIVSDFVDTDSILKECGFIEKFYEENTRERYMLGDVEIDIDTWPLLAPYIEIEGKSWNDIKKVANDLGFDWDKHLKCSTMQIYKLNGIDENSYSILTFEKQIKK